jgi:pilus assembly protein TadC
MTWLLATAYVAAAALALTGLATRLDPRVADRLSRAGDPAAAAAGRGPLARAGARVKGRTRERVAARMLAAGRSPHDLDSVLGQKVALGAAGVVVGLLSVPRIGVGAFPAALVLALAGARWPEIRLDRLSRRRTEQARAAVPDLLDLVAVSVGAGLTARLALDRAVAAMPGPLAEHLAPARREVALGSPWRRALRGAADRSGLRELRRLASVLERSERLGSPVAERLRDLAREVRGERRALEEERARRAPVAMLFPLVFLILPAFVLAAVAPAVLVAVRGIE